MKNYCLLMNYMYRSSPFCPILGFDGVPSIDPSCLPSGFVQVFSSSKRLGLPPFLSSLAEHLLKHEESLRITLPCSP